MYWIIGICAVVVFNVLVFMFMYGAGKQNKAYDKALDEQSNIKTCDELGDELCDYCPLTRSGDSVNTNQYNLCEVCKCSEAYDNYLDENK